MAASIVTCRNCGTKNRLRADPERVPRCAKCGELLPWLVDADPSSFHEELKASVPVLVDFWAPWCGPCKMIEPALDNLARTHAGRMKIVRLNVDEAPEISGRYGVQGIPLLLLMRDGHEIERMVGALPERQIEARVKPHLEAAAPAS
jgi:thioredoxin 2